MTDTEIINLFFERSEQAIEELDKKHGSAVASVARNILGNAQGLERHPAPQAKPAADICLQNRAQSCDKEVSCQHSGKEKQPVRPRTG